MDSSEPQVRCALITASVVGAALMLILATVNILVDPYLVFDMPRVSGFNTRKPAVRTQQLMMKAEDVLRVEPTTVLLGSSRVNIGIDAEYAGWPPAFRPVYNLALPGGSPHMAHRYLEHLIWRKSPAVVMLGLDFEYFLTKDPLAEQTKLPAIADDRLTVDGHGHPNEARSWRRALDLFGAAASLETSLDSALTVYSNLVGESHDISSGTWLTNAEHLWGPSVPYVYFTSMNLLIFQTARDKMEDQRVVGDVRKILDLCSERGIRAVLFINPVHADDLEAIDSLGYWNMFEQWKRKMLALSVDYSNRNPHGPVYIWDFTGYDEYTTEPVCEGECNLRWFYDSLHYTPELGNLTIQALIGAHAAAEFGVLLTPTNIDEHLLSIRRQQLVYRASYKEAAKRVQGLHGLISQRRRTN